MIDMVKRHTDNDEWYNPTWVNMPYKLLLSSFRSKRTHLPSMRLLQKLGIKVVVKFLECLRVFQLSQRKRPSMMGSMTSKTLNQLPKPPYTRAPLGIQILKYLSLRARLSSTGTVLSIFKSPDDSDGELVL